MASLLPLISELLPMVMPAPVEVTRAKDLQPVHPTVEGPVLQRDAIMDKCDKMCASVLTIRPRSSTPIRHNSEQDAIMYLVSGSSILTVKEGFDDNLQRHELSLGDFVFVPAWTEHQACNETGEDASWLVIQSGPRRVGAVLVDWGGAEVVARD